MIYDLPTRKWEPLLKKIVLSYLRRQDFLEWYCPGIEYDAFDVGDLTNKEYEELLRDQEKASKLRISGAGHALADGTWSWRDDLPYYVDVHDIDLPEEFIVYVLDYYISLLRPAAEYSGEKREPGTEPADVNIMVPPVLDSFSMNGLMISASGKTSNLFGDEYVEKQRARHEKENQALLEFYEELIERFDELVKMRANLNV